MDLLSKKSEVLDAFKKFKATIELKLGNLIKCFHLDRDDEFYDRYDETGKNPSPFAKYLQECGIIQCLHTKA